MSTQTHTRVDTDNHNHNNMDMDMDMNIKTPYGSFMYLWSMSPNACVYWYECYPPNPPVVAGAMLGGVIVSAAEALRINAPQQTLYVGQAINCADRSKKHLRNFAAWSFHANIVNGIIGMPVELTHTDAIPSYGNHDTCIIKQCRHRVLKMHATSIIGNSQANMDATETWGIAQANPVCNRNAGPAVPPRDCRDRGGGGGAGTGCDGAAPVIIWSYPWTGLTGNPAQVQVMTAGGPVFQYPAGYPNMNGPMPGAHHADLRRVCPVAFRDGIPIF